MPPQPPIHQEQAIQQKLVECGLNADGFTVKYEDYLQSIEIVIDESAGASESDFACIHKAVDHEIVTFKKADLQVAYLDFVGEIYRPQMLAEAEKSLEKRGLLKDFPERASFSTDKLFAEALERHCGVERGSFFVESEWGLTAQPQMTDKPIEGPEWDKVTCLMSAMMYVAAKGEVFKVGFIGNEAIPDESE